jgi:hypothetical protein
MKVKEGILLDQEGHEVRKAIIQTKSNGWLRLLYIPLIFFVSLFAFIVGFIVLLTSLILSLLSPRMRATVRRV